MNQLLLGSLFVLALSGCLKTREQLRGEVPNNSLQRQSVQQQLDQAREAKEKAAPGGYKFEEVDEQMRQLNGRVDALENSVSLLNAAGTNERDNQSKLIQAQDQKFAIYEDALKKLETQVQSLNQEVERLRSANTPVKTSPQAGSKSSYEEGEALFGSKKWREAIVSYQKYRDGNPKGKFYPDATYKIGVAFQELGMKDEAKAFFDEVREKFPTSKEAKKAAIRVKSIK